MGGSRGAVMLRFRDQAWHHLARRRHCLGVRAFSTTTGTASHCITSDFGLSSGCQMHPEVQQAQECDDCGMLAGAKEVRINLWYAFAQRPDTRVVDEPLYAHYLTNINPTAIRPYRDQVLAAQEHDGNAIVRNLMLGQLEPSRPVLFLKHMAKHFAAIDKAFLSDPHTHNVILTRDPNQILASWARTLGAENSRYEDTGLERQLELVAALQAAGRAPIVVTNDDLIARPEGTLRAICEAVGLQFDPRMLKWDKGGRPEDGVWAAYWYKSTHLSTGFKPELRTPPNLAEMPASLRAEGKRGAGAFQALTSLALRPKAVLPFERNDKILVYVNGKIVPRARAKISVFDSAVQGGDAVWEGLRVYDGTVFALDEHIDRLLDSAKALLFEDVPSRQQVRTAVFETLKANGMRDGVHIRLTLTRGEKVTSGMSPTNNQSGPSLIVLAEWKGLVDSSGKVVGGLSPQTLITSSIRRNTPACLDSKIHHCNLLNNILAKIQANMARADDALMLDVHGFVSETNATNFFIVKRGVLITPHADACLPGITRGMVIEIARELGIKVEERNVSLAEVYAADEAFTTGTMGALVPVSVVDGRVLTHPVGETMQRLQEGYLARTRSRGVPIS